jgi:probable F420-dependent oxidoreductase
VRFTIELPTHRVDRPDEFLSAAAVAEMARALEAAGADACFVTDHPIPGDAWLASGGHHTLDPFVALAFAAAATTRLRLQTHVAVLPYRNPFLTAKAAASLDALSGGRLILGVATGYLESEFAALGVDPAERNALTDEAIDVMRRAWTESGLAFEGRHFIVSGNTMLPRPAQAPGPPIWIGGNSQAAIRRAVERGDGWLPFPAPRGLARSIRTASIRTLDDLAGRLAYARAHADSVGRTRALDVCFAPLGVDLFDPTREGSDRAVAHLRELEALGVTWIAVNVPCRTRSEYCAAVAGLGRRVIGALR